MDKAIKAREVPTPDTRRMCFLLMLHLIRKAPMMTPTNPALATNIEANSAISFVLFLQKKVRASCLKFDYIVEKQNN